MKVQYISDSAGKANGVYIPIEEWEFLKQKYKGLEDEEAKDIPQWHKDIVSARIKEYNKNPSHVYDFDAAMDDIEKDL